MNGNLVNSNKKKDKKEKALFLKTKKQFPNLENIFNILLTKKKKKSFKEFVLKTDYFFRTNFRSF